MTVTKQIQCRVEVHRLKKIWLKVHEPEREDVVVVVPDEDYIGYDDELADQIATFEIGDVKTVTLTDESDIGRWKISSVVE